MQSCKRDCRLIFTFLHNFFHSITANWTIVHLLYDWIFNIDSIPTLRCITVRRTSWTAYAIGNRLTFLPKLHPFPPPLTTLHDSTGWSLRSLRYTCVQDFSSSKSPLLVRWLTFETFITILKIQILSFDK